MASARCIADTIAYLMEIYPLPPITAHTAPVWERVLSGLTDEEVERGANICLAQTGRKFRPAPTEVRDAVTPPITINVEQILSEISALGAYNPRTGWQYPRAETVREKLGDGIAAAYGVVGPSLLFSDNLTAREIAQREFADELKHTARQNPLALKPPEPPKKLGDGSDPKR